jgi:hypothetical protein
MVLLEFQSREAMFKHKLWSSLMHDHVNIFSGSDFRFKYDVIEKGDFAFGEWQYVLLAASNIQTSTLENFKMEQDIKQDFLSRLFYQREVDLHNLTHNSETLIICGAAGKGINVAFALKQFGASQEIYAMDSLPSKHNLFMECSGVKVINPESKELSKWRDPLFVIVNPFHSDAMRKLIPVDARIYTLGISQSPKT